MPRPARRPAPCRNCGGVTLLYARQLCRNCYAFAYRTGRPRPLHLAQRQPCSRCGATNRRMVLGVCQRCDDEERRMRQERPVRTLDSPYARWAQETLRSPHLHRAALSERQRAVLERRAAGCTLQEIADALGVTRERIRQIEGQCRRRLARAAGTVAHPPVVRQAGSALPSAAPRLRRSNSPPA